MMRRPSWLSKTFLAAILLTVGFASTRNAAAEPTSVRRPTLAAFVSATDPAKSGQGQENIEDLLFIELANQHFLQIVDRQKLQSVLKEHAVALSNVGNVQNAVALGKFTGADYLLHVVIEKNTAGVRLVEVAGGKVALETDFPLAGDFALTAAAVRERVLAALSPESQAKKRLTVGIAALINRSGTDRSDKLGVELQKALRKRLQEQPWAVVLERQYPTSLLDEIDLARLGLVRDNAVEKLPPADLVILGTLDDVGREFEPGKPWKIKFELTLRLREKSKLATQTFTSETPDAAVEAIMREIEDLRRQPISQTAVPEKELWRRQALYLMPRPMLRGYKNAVIPEFYSTTPEQQREVIRAWQNVLLLDENNAEAMTGLAVCAIGFSRWWYTPVNISPAERNVKSVQWIAASRLLERAINAEHTRERAATYLYCLRSMIDAVPDRAKEMAKYVRSHPEQFSGIPKSPWVDVALTISSVKSTDFEFAKIDSALANADADPNAVLIVLPEMSNKYRPKIAITELYNKYRNSSDSVVQFALNRAMGEMLSKMKKDPAALAHFDKAIEVMEPAFAKCRSPHRNSINNIYRLKIEACQLMLRRDEAKNTAWAGAKHFMNVDRFDSREHFNASGSWIYNDEIAWLYNYCVTDGMENGRESEAMAVCDVYLAAAKKTWMLSSVWPRISAKREELMAKLSGKRPPDMSAFQLVSSSTWKNDMSIVPMAAMGETLWYSSGVWGNIFKYEGNQNIHLPQIPYDHYGGIAAVGGAIYCGGQSGLHKLDAAGNLVKTYTRENSSLPDNHISAVCESGDKIYFAFRAAPNYGVASFDPKSEKVAVLSPSSRNATSKNEPVESIDQLWWDPVDARLYTFTYFLRSCDSPQLTRQYSWSPNDATWVRHPLNEARRYIVPNGGETMVVRSAGENMEFSFVKSGQKIVASVPAQTVMGRPAWDAKHIWAPTASGLYEIDRATGNLEWIAYQDNNFFRQAMCAGNRLYLYSTCGMYYRDICKKADQSTVVVNAPKSGVANASAVISFDLSFEDEAKAEATISIDNRNAVLKKTSAGIVDVDLSAAAKGHHLIYFQCPGHATAWSSIDFIEGRLVPNPVKIKMYRKRYVILRYAFNTTGGRSLSGEFVEEDRVASSHWSTPKLFYPDWQIWQTSKDNDTNSYGGTPFLRFHRHSQNFGFMRPAPNIAYEQMKEAPVSGYHCENIKAEKGLALYCRVNGNTQDGLGYGKIIVEDVTETPPDDVRVVDSP